MPIIANTEGGVASQTSHRFASRRSSSALVSHHGLLDSALERTRDWLLARQAEEGYWVAELEGDTILESEYVLLMTFLGRESDRVCAGCARYIEDHQLSEGGWAIYPGGPTDVSASVKAYFALKLTGRSPDEPAMARARGAILEAGGAHQCNSFTRFYLALLGQIAYDDCPCVPPELLLIPPRWGFSLSAMSAWTRTIVVPLSIMSYFKPVRSLSPEQGIAELFREDPQRPARRTRPGLSWTNVFLGLDRVFKWLDRRVPAAWRQPAIRAAQRWMMDHCRETDGLGAIFPPMVYSVIALRCLGFDPDSPEVRWALKQLEGLHIAEGDRIRVQPCLSPVWDTAIATIALADARLPAGHAAWTRAVQWLLAKEVRDAGDWATRGPAVAPTGWHFQFHNKFYPDLDDSAMVILALNRSPLAGDPAVQAATRRGVDWLLAMQNRDGGWAAYDVNIDNQVLTQLPFADHNAMLDPSCADITARVLELLGTLGYRADHPAIRRALDYLWSTQEPEGCWYGRWGVNYIYGTWQVLQGLATLGFPMDHPRLLRAVAWLESTQQPSGAWGESCRSYDDPALKGIGEPTPSQTAWATLGLIAAGRARTHAVRLGIDYLLRAQLPDGSWDEAPFTGTGFPRVFYLRYHYYRISFPIMALARYRAALEREPGLSTPAMAFRIPAQPVPTNVGQALA
ncbi:MAG TPA: squalene--hopene cyclase [Isosphaeraceae bacterium]|nr:squalene--hopene cyclase [Isosphaeraceae bacterium]